MRKASIIANHDKFETQLREVSALSARVFDAGYSATERNLALEGLALLVASYWEELVNDDFVDALNRDTTQYSRHVGLQLPKNLSRDVCFGLLVGDKYLDFRSVGDIIGRSRELIVPANNPFDAVPTHFRPYIDDFQKLRNYLSHRSYRAYRAYAKMLAGSRYGYVRVVAPGQFLRAEHRPGTRRFVHFLEVFRQASEAVRADAPF